MMRQSLVLDLFQDRHNPRSGLVDHPVHGRLFGRVALGRYQANRPVVSQAPRRQRIHAPQPCVERCTTLRRVGRDLYRDARPVTEENIQVMHSVTGRLHVSHDPFDTSEQGGQQFARPPFIGVRGRSRLSGLQLCHHVGIIQPFPIWSWLRHAQPPLIHCSTDDGSVDSFGSSWPRSRLK